MSGTEKSERLGNCIVMQLAKNATNVRHCGWNTAQVMRDHN